MPRRTLPRQGPAPLRGEVEQVLEEVSRYFRGGRRGKFNVLSGFGQVLSVVADLLRGVGVPGAADIEQALDVMAESGLTPPSGSPRGGRSAPSGGYSHGERAWPVPPTPATRSQRGYRVAPPRTAAPPPGPATTGRQPPARRPPPDLAAEDDWPEEHLVDTRVVSAPLEAVMSGKDPLVWTETPQSSNVYSFAFDRDEGILYVTFKAPSKERPRPQVTGPTYAYGSKARPIPPRLFESLARASSKGRWVWDHLRVRGSRWRHQVPYILAYGGFDASGEQYIPRKATARGFRVRTVPVVGQGRRGAAGRSNLPEQIFSSISPRTLF